MENSLVPGISTPQSSGSGVVTSTGQVKYPGIDKYGWYDVNSYVNNGGYSFIGNNYEKKVFPTTFNARTYKLVNGKWIVTEQGDDWVRNLPSAGGKAFVGSSLE